MITRHRIFMGIVIALFGLLWTVPALMLWWYVENPPFLIGPDRGLLAKEVMAGGNLKIRINSSTSTRCVGTVYRTIVDDTGRVFTFEPERRPSDSSYVVDLAIPPDAKPGQARYQARIDWECNPLQRIWPKVILRPDLEFTILPNPKQQSLYEEAVEPLKTQVQK
jgi:hypothetical protein